MSVLRSVNVLTPETRLAGPDHGLRTVRYL